MDRVYTYTFCCVGGGCPAAARRGMRRERQARSSGGGGKLGGGACGAMTVRQAYKCFSRPTTPAALHRPSEIRGVWYELELIDCNR